MVSHEQFDEIEEPLVCPFPDFTEQDLLAHLAATEEAQAAKAKHPLWARSHEAQDDLAVQRFVIQQAQIEIAEILIRQFDATRADTDDLEARNLNGRTWVAEAALQLQIPEVTAQNMVGRSGVMLRCFPTTVAEVRACSITLRHAEIIADIGAGISDDHRARFEKDALKLAREVTPPKLSRLLALMRDRLEPDSATQRHQTAMERRRVDVTVDRDGMGYWSAYLAIESIASAQARVTAYALSAKASGDDSRTLAQIEADVFEEIMLGERDADSSVRPTIFVTVSADTLVGGDAPGELNGFGQIPADAARKCAGDASSFYRVVLEPDTGNILEFSSSSRRIPAAMKRYLRMRDGTCRFPGCNRGVMGADIDHTVDFAAGGPTAVANLAHLCRKHHRFKHLASWRGVQDANAVITWTSPSGRKNTTRPEMVMPRFTVSATHDSGGLDDDPPPF